MLSGIIPVYKEKGFTSFDVVAKLRKILNIKKIGHTGTLDPDAKGVLAVCVGSATKLVERLTDKPKEYEARMVFGIRTDTQDMSGNVTGRGVLEKDADEIRKSILSFKGVYDQIPPMYSALKVGGKKLYELAREGKTVDRKPRRVHIYDISVSEVNVSADPPFADIRVRCSKGTYIRTLIDDCGERLGCGASMMHLLRTEAAGFKLEECLKLSQIAECVEKSGAESVLIPAERCFDDLKKVRTLATFDKLLYNGNKLCDEFFEAEPGIISGESIRVYDSENEFKAVYRREGDTYKIEFMF